MIKLEYENEQKFDVELLKELMDPHGEAISWDVLVVLLENSMA